MKNMGSSESKNILNTKIKTHSLGTKALVKVEVQKESEEK